MTEAQIIKRFAATEAAIARAQKQAILLAAGLESLAASRKDISDLESMQVRSAAAKMLGGFSDVCSGVAETHSEAQKFMMTRAGK